MATFAAPHRFSHPARAAQTHRHPDHGLLPSSHLPQVDGADVPLGRDHGLMLWIVGLVLGVSVAVIPAALINQTWVLFPLTALLIASAVWLTIFLWSLASDRVD
jgi:hypothetical protein